MKFSFLGVIAVLVLSIWLILVLFGKGGFVHMLLLSGIALAVIDLICAYRPTVSK